MNANRNIPDPTAELVRHVAPRRGRWRRWLVNLLLRLLVKWTTGLRLDVGRLRRMQSGFDGRIAMRSRRTTRHAVDCRGVSAEWVTPSAHQTDRVLLYLHGGAFVARSPGLHAAMVARWCEALGIRALMVDYRLAPESPWPAAVDDCHTAWRWLLEQGFDARQIVIGGDSAGGNLALSTLLRIKAAGESMPACAVLLSPFVDFTLSSPSLVENARRDPLFTLPFALSIRGCYALPERYLDPDVSPVFGDFAGLPPLLLQAGSTEMLRDDAVRTAERAHAAGVPATVELWDRLPHVFQALSWLPQSGEAGARIVDFIQRHTGWTPCETRTITPVPASP